MRRALFTCPAPSPQYELKQVKVNTQVFDGKINHAPDGLLDTTLGWNGNEYQGFKEMPMYSEGKNKDSDTQAIGTAYIAYDCSTGNLCVAAYLSDQTYFEDKDCKVVESENTSWVSINDREGGDGVVLYKPPTASNFKWVKVSTDRTIGK